MPFLLSDRQFWTTVTVAAAEVAAGLHVPLTTTS
jgi:hypothetical protein